MSKQLLRRWISHPLPSLKQGSTLSIRSSLETNISIRSQWRDDGHLSMLQSFRVGGDVDEADVIVSQEKDRTTSMGRDESHMLIQLKPKDVPSEAQENNAESQNHGDSTMQEPKVILHDGTVLPDSSEWSPPPPGLQRIEYSEGIALIVNEEEKENENDEQVLSLALEVPEKVNVECDLTNGGSISMHNKIEGDVRIFTSNGDVLVKKLRGHSLNISAQGAGNTVYSSDLLEAQTLNISIPSSAGRFRAKRVHASSCDFQIGSVDSDSGSSSNNELLLDNDDVGAMCDISSLYMTGDASIRVRSIHEDTRQAVRIKSHHGHVIVDASTPKPNKSNAMTGDTLPMVDMGGVNGSVEVHIHDDFNQHSGTDGWVSCHAHFDSISSDSVSILKADMGDIHVTMDRKVESDMRLLSTSTAASVDVDTLLLEQDDEDYKELIDMLQKLDESSTEEVRREKKIKIRTKAFTEKDKDPGLIMQNGEYVDGWVENKSEEPDSRFDRKLRGDAGSIGKIRLDGAADQALQGFLGGGRENEKSSFPRPIVAIASTGEIVLETVSWLGNIARRYGLDDKRDQDDLGRTATRRGRPLE